MAPLVIGLSLAQPSPAQGGAPPSAGPPASDEAPGTPQPGAAAPISPGSASVPAAVAPSGAAPGPGSPPPYGYGYGYPYPPPYWQGRREQRERTWYGWQTLLADGASIGLLLVASSGRGESLNELYGAGALGYFLAPPIVHWAHGNVGTGFVSLGIRAGAATLSVLGAVGCVSFYGSSTNGTGCVVMVVGLLGMVAAIPIDAAALAYDEPKDDAVALGPVHHLALLPEFGPGSGARGLERRIEGVALDTRAVSLGGFHGGVVMSGQF